MMERTFAKFPGFDQMLQPLIPSARMGTADEVAAVVVWLCSDAASFVTGHGLVVDGGLLAQ